MKTIEVLITEYMKTSTVGAVHTILSYRYKKGISWYTHRLKAILRGSDSVLASPQSSRTGRTGFPFTSLDSPRPLTPLASFPTGEGTFWGCRRMFPG